MPLAPNARAPLAMGHKLGPFSGLALTSFLQVPPVGLAAAGARIDRSRSPHPSRGAAVPGSVGPVGGGGVGAGGGVAARRLQAATAWAFATAGEIDASLFKVMARVAEPGG